MSLSCATGSTSLPGAASSASVSYVQVLGNSFAAAVPGGVGCYMLHGLAYPPTIEQFDETILGASGSWNSTVGPLTADEDWYFRAHVWDSEGDAYGATRSRRSPAMVATASTPTSSAITSTTATIACDYVPNVLRSTASAQLQYKRTVDSVWTNAGTAGALGGYVTRSVSANLTGLSPLTQYQVRLVITRTTGNDTTLTSTVASFTTLAGLPIVNTASPLNLAVTTATLRGTLDINEATGVNCYFKYGPAADHDQYTTANIPMSADGVFTKGITGLTASTQYFFTAYVSFTTPAGSPIAGTELNFTTTGDPEADAQAEARMQVYEFKRKYGVLLAAGAAPNPNGPLFFTLQAPSGTNSNTFVVGATIGAADCLISKDGNAFAQTTNQPTTLGNGYLLILTAAELQCNEADIIIKDAAGGPDFRDCHLRVITHVQLGSVDVDAASGSKANTTAFKATGYGTGNGIQGIAGATGKDIAGILGDHVLRSSLIATGGAAPALDASASSTTDFYKNMLLVITSGTGAGQARVISAYNGTTKAATVNRAWATNPGTGAGYIIIAGQDTWNVSPGAELAAVPTYASTFGQLLQLVFQRFAYKITQTATVSTFYKADAATSLGTRSVGDDGTTQTVGMLS